MRNIQGDQRPGQDSNRAHPTTGLVVLHSYTSPICETDCIKLSNIQSDVHFTTGSQLFLVSTPSFGSLSGFGLYTEYC
jgi:hypothetical protein